SDVCALHHHGYIHFEDRRLARRRKLEHRTNSTYAGSVLRVGQQGHLRATAPLHLRIVEHSATDAGLREAASNPALNSLETDSKHGVGYLSGRRVSSLVCHFGFWEVVVYAPIITAMM